MLLELLAVKEINKPPTIPQPKPVQTVQVEQKPKPKTIKPTKYTIKKGDTLTKIAKAHKTTWKRIWYKNKKINNPDSIKVGVVLILPSKHEKLKKRTYTAQKPKQALVTVKNSSDSVFKPSTGLNGYEYPSCTGYVASRRYVPAGWGNATDWMWHAQNSGFETSSTPRAGAIGWVFGHVVFVESVSGDSVVISEANYDYNGSIRTITVPASSYQYIY
jgi:surface antigen